MQPLMRAFILFFLSALWFSHVQAQSAADDPPLMASMTTHDAPFVHYDLYQYTNDQWQAVTTGGFKGGFSVSPDGRFVAYRSVPDFLKDAVTQDADNLFLLGAVWNITLLDLTTGEQREIAGQPPNVELSDQQIDNGTERSLPVWSPDSSALAWSEQDYPLQSSFARLVTYDLANGETHVIDDALPTMISADGLPTLLSWGEPGIAVFTNDPDTGNETFRLYDLATGTRQIVAMYFANLSPWYPQGQLLWIDDGDGQTLVVHAEGSFWYRIDPNSGAVSSMTNALDFVSAAAPATSLRLQWDVQAVPNNIGWRLVDTNGDSLSLWETDSLRQFAFAPSGQSMAYLEDGRVYRWENGSVMPLAVPDDLEIWQLFWGPIAVQLGTEYSAIG